MRHAEPANTKEGVANEGFKNGNLRRAHVKGDSQQGGPMPKSSHLGSPLIRRRAKDANSTSFGVVFGRGLG
jgi:hypothetical protein